MAKVTKNCRVCGALFTPCARTFANTGRFIWREFACSPECGGKYLELIMASRNPNNEVIEPTINTTDTTDESKDESIARVNTKPQRKNKRIRQTETLEVSEQADEPIQSIGDDDASLLDEM